MAHVIVGHPTSGFGGYERIAGRGLFFAGGFTELVDLTAAQQAALVSRGYTVDGQPDPPVADPWPQYMTSPEVRTLVMTDEEIRAAQRAASVAAVQDAIADGDIEAGMTAAEIAASPTIRATFGTVVGTFAAPITSAGTARPTGAAHVTWMCAPGVAPTNAVGGDHIWNADA